MGEGSGLVCHTDLAGCCEGNTGDWYYPNGSVVMEDGALYVSRGQMSVSLMMSETATGPGGVYCCVVPTSGGMSTACIVLGWCYSNHCLMQSIYRIIIIGHFSGQFLLFVLIQQTLFVLKFVHSNPASTDESPLCQSDNTGAVVGGVVALVAVIAVTVVMVAYLRYKREGKM